MPKFSYSARDKSDKAVSGVVEASSKTTAMETLVKQGLKPSAVHETKTGFDPNHLNLKFMQRKHVKPKDMVVFSRQLSTMINAGVPLVRSLSTLRTQTKSEYFKSVIDQVAKDVEGGATLADALGKHPNVFSDIYVNMIRAGEAAGILDEILKRLATQQEKDAAMRKKIRSASTYPAVLLGITTIAFFVLMIFIVPKIGKIVKDLAGEDATLPPYTQAMLGLSDFIVDKWYILLIGAVATVILTRRYIKSPKGKRKWHALLLKMPIASTIVRKIAIARFARVFSSLLGAGVSMLDSIHITGRAVGNIVIQEELDEAAKAVKNGQQLSEPLSNSKIFPPIVAQMLAVGEESGQIDTILVKVADSYEDEVDALIDGLSAALEPLMIVVLGSIVGLIAASVMGPIASLSQQI